MIAEVEAEERLLGAVLLNPARYMQRCEDEGATADWFTGRRQRLWETLQGFWASGEALDFSLTRPAWDREAIRTACPMDDFPDVWSQLEAMGYPMTGTYQLLRTTAYRRRLQTTGHQCIEAASDAFLALPELASLADAATATLGVEPPGEVSTSLRDLFEEREQSDPWVVPAILRRGWRALIVGAEGKGKSTLMQQVGVGAAYGIHPFRLNPIPPQRVLVVDCENPRGHVRDRVVELARVFASKAGADPDGPDRLHVWREPSGVDLRQPLDQGKLRSLIRRHQPELLVMGPTYKLARKRERESDEDFALATQEVVELFRRRWDFALLMEAHAPHGDSAAAREMRPIGSSAWLRWPEIGISLKPPPPLQNGRSTCPENSYPPNWKNVNDGGRNERLVLKRYRGDRVACTWPAWIDRGTAFSLPWEGEYPGGHE